jgi:hypothetical protein
MVGLHSLQTVYFLINSAILKRIRNNDNNYYDTDHSLWHVDIEDFEFLMLIQYNNYLDHIQTY